MSLDPISAPGGGVKTFTVILEYCGGSQTDCLFERLRSWNPGREIEVLDNASQMNRCSCITQQNTVNTYIGGGIVDCFRLANAHYCDNLFFIVNDIEPITPIVIDHFETALAKDRRLVQVAASVTSDSTPHAEFYPWMVALASQKLRRVPHADLLCCIIQNSFIQSFGGFLPSRGGWGYDWELAHQALIQGRHIAIADSSVVRHKDDSDVESRRTKYREMIDTYKSRYPNSEFLIQHTMAEYWIRGTIQFADQ
jgi:hypothetical protein